VGYGTRGAGTVGGIERGSLEFYRAIRKHRNESYDALMPPRWAGRSGRNKDALEIARAGSENHYHPPAPEPA
jgi:hypothetical protein